ncbi:MAG: hypothetical protein AAGA35_03545 [Patescibacteria group bacterium]
MFRDQAREELLKLAEENYPPDDIKVEDSYGNTVRMTFPPGGDINLSIWSESGTADITLAGVGGGDNRPLMKEALRLLALAMQREGNPGRG